MAGFFAVGAVATTLGYLAALALGLGFDPWGLGPQGHLMLGLGSAIAGVCLHCLIFAIFTGAGKDTRLLVEDLKLDASYVKRMKAFKFEVFPPALYAIGALLVLSSLGGALSSSGSLWLRWAHFGAAWVVLAYNLKVFRQEFVAIRANARLLEEVNRAASAVKPSMVTGQGALPVLDQAAESYEWGAHVYALGRFLTFLGVNTWLPYLYLRFVVGYIKMPWWPYLLTSLVFLASGAYLKVRYASHRPWQSLPSVPVQE